MGNNNLALLIDGDNVAYSKIAGLLEEIATYGTASVKRIYGDWTNPNLKGWKRTLLSHSITPIQQFAIKTGKNATDGSMIIDAMDLLHTGRYSTFCIVSSDSDFTRLASRIREQGANVYGFGDRLTNNSFVAACDKFVYFDVLNEDSEASKDSPPFLPPSRSKSSMGSIVERDQPTEQIAHVTVLQRSRSVKPRIGPIEVRDETMDYVAPLPRSRSVSGAKMSRPSMTFSQVRDETMDRVSPLPRSRSVSGAKMSRPGVGVMEVRDHSGEKRSIDFVAPDRTSPIPGVEIPIPKPVVMGTMVVRDPTLDQKPVVVRDATERPIDFAARDAIKRAIQSTKGYNDGWVDLVDVGSLLNGGAPDLLARNYGFTRLREFVEATGLVEMKYKSMGEKGSVALVRLKVDTSDRWSRY